jgi:hypothetical protein
MPRIGRVVPPQGPRRQLSDDQRRDLLDWCRWQYRVDPRILRRALHGKPGRTLTFEEELAAQAEYERLHGEAERDALALFSERLKALEAARG